MLRPYHLLLLLPLATPAAEPEVTGDELPRVPPLAPERALQSFQIRPGFRLELAACEPEVVDPVAIAFDETSALYVVEMRDYSERRAEKLSRVRRLEDRDGDGRFEHSTVFLEGLPWATSVTCWDGGVFVAASPDIVYAKDTNNDGVADLQRVVFTGFGEGRNLNVQALVNSLQWGPGNRIYGATAGNGGRIRRVRDGTPEGEAINVDGADFSFDPKTLDFRPETGTAQYGMTFDEFGERYVCSNSAHLQWVAYSRALAKSPGIFPLPQALVNIPVDGPAAEVYRLSPEEPWRVVRTRWRASGLVPGLIEGGGRSTGYFTSASGVHISGGLVCRGDAFIGDVGSNLVHRKVITWDLHNGPMARRAEGEERMEFLTSTDNWFRPVSFATGPDGGLYVVDMYREFIEHPASLPPNLKKHLDLNSGNDRGRIWRIVPEKFVRKPWPKFAQHSAPAAEPATTWLTLAAERLDHARGTNMRQSLPWPDAGTMHVRTQIGAARTASAEGTFDSDFFNLPFQDEAADWQPSMAAQLARHGIRSKEQAQKIFGGATGGRSPLVCFRLAVFLETPLTSKLAATAMEWLKDSARDEKQRLAAVEALAQGHRSELAGIVTAPDYSPGVRAAALRSNPGTAVSLLTSWQAQPGALRAAALETLTSSNAAALLAAVKAGTVSASEIPAHLAEQLRRQPGADKILPPPQPNRQAVIAARQGALKVAGDAVRGRTIFHQVCITCHRDGNEGAGVGPDRVSFKNQGKPILMGHILDPNREVPPRFFTATISTRSGESFAGIIAEESAASVSMLMPAGLQKVIAREQILKLERSNRSLMPEGLEAAWTDGQLADLLAFLVQ